MAGVLRSTLLLNNSALTLSQAVMSLSMLLMAYGQLITASSGIAFVVIFLLLRYCSDTLSGLAHAPQNLSREVSAASRESCCTLPAMSQSFKQGTQAHNV